MPRRRRPHTRSTAARGYGGAHQREREKYRPAVDAGYEHCRRCLRPIPPGGRGRCPKCGKDHGNWDLGHLDTDRSVWTGPEHMCCNRATAGRRKPPPRPPRRTSREW